MKIRDYKNSDKEAVLALLRLNSPKFFSTVEENDLVDYLENKIERYYVIDIDGKVVGSGGINFSNGKKTGIISWDIIDPDFQGRSLGTMLLTHRIKVLNENKMIGQIVVRTSQLAYKFYGKQGFELIDIVEDHWAKGYHLYNMVYKINS